MTPVTTDRFVHLADVGDLITAQICVALLADAGIEARVHGESLGPYRVTVGRMAVTQIWVPGSYVEEAGAVLMEAEIDHALGTEVRGGALSNPSALPMRLAAALIGGILLFAVVRELMRVF